MEVQLSPALLRQAKEHASSDEELARFLKQAGLSKMFSVVACGEVMGVSAAQAKTAIHRSRAWASSRQAIERVHEALFQAVAAGDPAT